MKNGSQIGQFLTPRQYQLLEFIEKYRKANDSLNPTQREINRSLGGSLNSTQEILAALLKKRILGQKKGSARALQILNPQWKGLPILKLGRKPDRK